MQKIRNIAIIAHVDHGKTTLVDKMLLAGKLFRDNQSTGELILDNNDLERERGITILSKNVSITYKDYKINIIDTPGHADFGGEVERVLNMADGCLLLVDAFEGPMPQTRFVLQKAIQMGLKPVVVINKVDKPNCRPDEVQEMVFDLMCNLDATEEQLDFPTIYGSAKQGWMSTDFNNPTEDITAVLDAIIEYIPEPQIHEGDAQMLITSLDYSNYVGRIAIGRFFYILLISRQFQSRLCFLVTAHFKEFCHSAFQISQLVRHIRILFLHVEDTKRMQYELKTVKTCKQQLLIQPVGVVDPVGFAVERCQMYGFVRIVFRKIR